MLLCRAPCPPSAGDACYSERPPWHCWVQRPPRAGRVRQLAGAAAPAAPPQLAPALTAVASERSAHARALEDELTRSIGQAPTTTEATTTSASPSKPPTVKDVIGALRKSADSASQLAAKLSGYRAGMLGSIAAACTAAYAVALVPPGQAP